ncbi:MAG TPA: glycosyltransferase family 39 protein, partial [Ktedonobacterales bacterium]|nr:glycosyltransferase family 39 protein [Ktedonobacterales bacterium]
MARMIHEQAGAASTTEAANRLAWRTWRAWGWPLRWLLAVVVMGGLGAYHWFVYTAQPSVPHRFTALEDLFRIGVAAAIILLGLLCGLRILRPLRVTASLSRVEVFALGAGLGLGALSLLTLVLGVAHLYYSATFVLLLPLGPWLFPTERRQVASAVRELPAYLRRVVRTDSLLFEKAACAVLALLSLSALALCYIRDLSLPASSSGYDTYQYHWAVPALLLRAHAWQAFPGWAHANLPFTTEMLNLIAIGLRAPTAASFVQDTFGLLFAALVFGLLRRHFGAVVAWFAVAAVATIPLLIAYASQSYVETALMFYGFASLTLLVLWLERGLGVGRAGVEALALAGVALGFAVSVKYTALEYVPGLALLLIAGCIALLVRAGDGVARRAVARLALAFGVGAAAPMLPWFAKNWIYDGNPVYPALTGLFGGPAWDSARDQTLTSTFQHFGPKTGLVARFHLYALDLFLHPDHSAETTPFPTGHIAWCAALALPVIAFALWRGWLTRTDRLRGQALVFIALTLATAGCLLVWNQSGALVLRYAIPPVALATVLGAALLGWLATVIFAHARIPTTARILR